MKHPNLMLLLAGVVGAGCAAPGPVGEELSRDEARLASGKADFSDDLCAFFGWYGDGICDEFCVEPDSDCAAGCMTDSDCPQPVCVTAPCPINVCVDNVCEVEPPAPAECFVGGCSSEVCSDTPGVVSTCEFLPEYACYADATCERQPDGVCGWTPTPELTTCLGGDPMPEPEPDPCYVGGCSSQICSDTPGVVSTCEFLPEYACYEDATCERQPDGVCGWTPTPELTACLNPMPEPDPCYVGGCSGQLCSGTPGLASTCEFLPEYACYADATCERQADGVCGWTATPDLSACLMNPPGT